MWHEARKQERKIRGLMVDYKKRAERRREFYEKIKLDPAQFVHIYGRPYKIHLDPATAMAAEGPQSMMPWQGETNNMIDRFDVRAHLDYISLPECDGKLTNPIKSKHEEEEERQCNYERYRSLVENEAAGLSEEQSLHQIYLDEQFGPIVHNTEEDEKKKKSDNKAAIAFTYDDGVPAKKTKSVVEEGESDDSAESSDTDIEAADLDVTIDVDMLTPDQTIAINICAEQYGMKDDDYIRLLRRDKEEIEALRQAKLMEEEKAQFSGRKSRRERRAYKDRRLLGRKVSPPSYAARDSPKYEPYKKSSSSSRSRSRTPDGPAKVMFITSFGEEEEYPVQGPCLPSTDNSHKSDSKGKSRLSASFSTRREGHSSLKGRRSSSSSSRSRSRGRQSRSRSRNRRSGSSPKRSSYSRHSRSTHSSDKHRHRNRSRSRSRKRSRSSSSRSRSSSYTSSSSLSSRSRSRSSRSTSPKPAIKSYRRESLSSKSDSSSDEEDVRKKNYSSNKNSYIASIGKSSSYNQANKLTPQEKMKKRMQAALSKQFKVDKKVEMEKSEKSLQERIDREEDLRIRSLEMRRREREKRHKEMEEFDRSRSRSRSRSPVRSRYRSRSRSPRSTRHSRRSSS